MANSKPRLAAARRHGRRALAELRHLSADAALYWVLSHRTRVAQFRRAVKGTRAARALDGLLAAIRSEATEIAPARRPRRAARSRTRRRARRDTAPRWLQAFAAQPFMM